MKKTTAAFHWKPILVHLMYLASMALFALFVFYAQYDGARYYSPLGDNSVIQNLVIRRAVQFLAPGIGILVLATIWNGRSDVPEEKKTNVQ